MTMTRCIVRTGAPLMLALLVLLTCGGAAPAKKSGSSATGDLGVDAAGLSSVIDNPYVPFARLKRAVYEGWELDDEKGDTVRVRSIVTVRDTSAMAMGIRTTVVDVTDYDGGVMVERSHDYYAQDAAGAVYYIASRVDDLEKGKVVGHDGQWFAGESHARAGLFMPATPGVGDTFAPERAPKVAESNAKVTRVGLTLTVPAGSYENCIEVEVSEPDSKSSHLEIYGRGIGKLRDAGKDHAIELKELELRPAAAGSDSK